MKQRKIHIAGIMSGYKQCLCSDGPYLDTEYVTLGAYEQFKKHMYQQHLDIIMCRNCMRALRKEAK